MNRSTVLLDLPRLIRGARQDQVGGQLRAQLGERRVDRLAEVADLLPGPHLDGERDRAAPGATRRRARADCRSSGTAPGSRSRGRRSARSRR